MRDLRFTANAILSRQGVQRVAAEQGHRYECGCGCVTFTLQEQAGNLTVECVACRTRIDVDVILMGIDDF